MHADLNKNEKARKIHLTSISSVTTVSSLTVILNVKAFKVVAETIIREEEDGKKRTQNSENAQKCT